jgi:arginine decarboxylase
MFPIPKQVFLTRGVGVHRHQLTAFEYALRDADIEQQNLVAVSSILPPGCELIPLEAGVATLKPGEITFCVMARAETNEPGRRISASVGMARPKDPAMYGYVSEHHGFGMTEEQGDDYAEDLAATMLASTLGIEFDPEAGWDERRHVYQMSDLIVDSLSLTAAAEGAASGEWTCAVVAAVFRFGGPSPAPHDGHPDLRDAAVVSRDRAARAERPGRSPASRSTSAPRTGPAPASAPPRSGPRAACWSTATTPSTTSTRPRCRSPTSATLPSRSATSRRAWR